MAAQRRVERQQTLQPIVGQVLVEQVRDVHQEHAEEVAHLLPAKAAQGERGFAEANLLGKRHGAGEIGGTTGQKRFQEAGMTEELGT